jgi:lipopolysaccharide export system permease protein
MLPGPIIGSLALLMFLLVMQFLMKYLPDLVGKGLPPLVFVELISYNLAYMLVLAVPMSILIASLLAFGRLVNSNAYSVIKSSGVSFLQLLWPVWFIGLMLTGVMWYFNNEILPQANFRARNLWQDIRVAKPGFDLKPGVFYDGIDQYSIFVGDVSTSDSDDLRDIIIYDYTDGVRYRKDISARTGRIATTSDESAITLMLFDGEIHRSRPPGRDSENRYERLKFGRHRLQISIEDLNFERSDPGRGRQTDRTMRTVVMSRLVDSLDIVVAEELTALDKIVSSVGSGRALDFTDLRRISDAAARLPAPVNDDGATRPKSDFEIRYAAALKLARMDQTEIDHARTNTNWASHMADTYRVEIHKKRSIAVAVLIFMLIGAPLGLVIKRGGFGIAATLAVFIFLFYWVTLVNGEKLADRELLAPWIGMWTGNIVTGLVAVGLMIYVSMDRRATR